MWYNLAVPGEKATQETRVMPSNFICPPLPPGHPRPSHVPVAFVPTAPARPRPKVPVTSVNGVPPDENGDVDVSIPDIEDIRAGAAKGATAYQLPETGVPKTDLASDVQASLGKADTALQEHQDISGKADLVDGTVPSSQLPSYVDDVLEYAGASAFPATGEAGKIYIALDTNVQYRWSGTQYSEIAKIVPPSAATPAMDGAGSAGSSNTYARGDHVHPTDTSRASTADVEELRTGKRDKLDMQVYGLGNASVAFPDGFSLTSPEGSGIETTYTAPTGGETIELFGPVKGSRDYYYWVPEEYKDDEDFDPVGKFMWCLYGSIPDRPEQLIYNADLSYNVADYNSETPSLELAFGVESGGHPTMERPVVVDGTIAKTSEIPAVVAPSTSASDSGSAADAKATGDALAGKADETTPIAVLPSNLFPVTWSDGTTTWSMNEDDASFTHGYNSNYQLNYRSLGLEQAVCFFDGLTGTLSGYASPMTSVKFNGTEGDIGAWPVVARFPDGGTVVRDQQMLRMVPRVTNPTANNLAALNSNGGIADSQIPKANVAMKSEVAAKLDSTSAAPEFSAKAYALNDPCTYNGVLYRCKSAYTATSSSAKPDADTTHWEAKPVSALFVPITGGTMTGDLTVPNLTVGSRKSGTAVGLNSVAEGGTNTASGSYSHAEGYGTKATSDMSHAEGDNTTASNNCAHAEGNSTTASGSYSHAEGILTNASGLYSHAEGRSVNAQNDAEHAQGKYNASHTGSTDADKTLSSIGFGSDSSRKNAVETMQDGKTFIYGLGGYDGTNPTGSGVKDLAAAVDGKFDSNSAAPEWQGSLAYAPPDRVTYAGGFYECTSAVAAPASGSSNTPPSSDTTHWKATDLVTPDATFDVTASGALRLVQADGTILWHQGYGLNTTSGTTPQTENVSYYAFAADATDIAPITMPQVPAGKVGDFILDVYNPALTTTPAAFSSAATYAVGDTVLYDGKKWTCVVAVDTAGAWTGTDNWQTASISFAGLETDFKIVVPKGKDLQAWCMIAPGEYARFYVTETAFQISGKPTWQVVKEVVEDAGGAS